MFYEKGTQIPVSQAENRSNGIEDMKQPQITVSRSTRYKNILDV